VHEKKDGRKKEIQRLIKKTEEIYKIDASDLNDIYLVEFFQRINRLK